LHEGAADKDNGRAETGSVVAGAMTVSSAMQLGRRQSKRQGFALPFVATAAGV